MKSMLGKNADIFVFLQNEEESNDLEKEETSIAYIAAEMLPRYINTRLVEKVCC